MTPWRPPDRLVKLAPSDARSWSRRARIRTNRALREMVRKPLGNEEEKGQQMFAALFPESSVPDLETAVRLQPKDPRLLMALTFHHLGFSLFAIMRSAVGNSGGNSLGSLSKSQQAAVRDTVAQLDRLGGEADRALAAAALESEAVLLMGIMGDSIGAGKTALRALRLDPSRNQAFELALGSTISGEKSDWKLAEEIVRERLMVRSDARTQLALVKVLNESGQSAPALAEVHEAIKAFPAVASLEISHVALHVRAGNYPGGREQENLETIGKALQALPDGEEKMLLSRNHDVTGVVMTALQKNVSEARQMLNSYLEKVTDDDYAKAIEALLKQMQ
ncbi:MAG: hypothetical protein EXS36_17805 [Pedosphaera sp.]|nr:hypothetical protein [Pedosphaera sp.]